VELLVAQRVAHGTACVPHGQLAHGEAHDTTASCATNPGRGRSTTRCEAPRPQPTRELRMPLGFTWEKPRADSQGRNYAQHGHGTRGHGHGRNSVRAMSFVVGSAVPLRPGIERHVNVSSCVVGSQYRGDHHERQLDGTTPGVRQRRLLRALVHRTTAVATTHAEPTTGSRGALISPIGVGLISESRSNAHGHTQTQVPQVWGDLGTHGFLRGSRMGAHLSGLSRGGKLDVVRGR